MRLKSIKLAGFKSFVDATTVPFPTNMTAIVGPNGCGKSNIIDAVRWVMGESSAKNLRGESMTDVIFNGASGRQPVGQASIELLFDNTSGKLTGEHAAFSEISIKRKVTREGVSQYYLNGTKCRRRDVTDIFLGTGMGPRSYAIIEQGMIAKLIESKPEELRIYLEEAAGISKYKERRRETENRMRRTEENLERLNDIREELGKQLAHLKRQANAAEKYAEYKKEERFNKALLNALRWKDLDEQLKEKQKLVSERETEIEKSVVDKTANQSKIESARLVLEDKQDAFNKVQAKYYESGAEIAKLEQQLKYQKERLVQQDRELSQLQHELTASKDRLNVDEMALAELNDLLEELLPKVEEAIEQAEISNAELDEKEQGMHIWQEEWDHFNNESASARQKAEVEQSTIQQSESRLVQLSDRKKRLENEREELETQLEDSDDLLSEELQTLELRLEEAQAVNESLYPQIEVRRAELDELNRQSSDLSRTLSEKKAVLASLRTIQKAAMGDVQGEEQQWLKDNECEHVQRVMEKIQVRGGWDRAVEHVLADWLVSPVVASDQTFKQLLHSQPNCSLNLVNDGRNESNVSVVPGTLAEHVKGITCFHDVLNKVLVVDTITDAEVKLESLKDEQSIVCKDGHWLSKKWVRYYFPGESQAGIVARKEEIDSLDQEIPIIESQLEEKRSSIESVNDHLKSIEAQLRDSEREVQHLSKEVSKLASVQSANNAKQEQVQIRMRRILEDLSEVEVNAESESERLLIAKESWQEAMDNLDGFTDQKEELLNRRESIQTALEASRNQARTLQNNVHQLQMEKQQKESQKQALDLSIQRLSETQAQITRRISLIEGQDRIDEESIDDLELQLEGRLEARLQDEARLSDARIEMEQVAISLREAEGERSNYELTIQESRAGLEQLRMECQAFDINKKALQDAVESDEFTLESLFEALDDEHDESGLIAELERLQTRVQRLGPINLAAIDEYQTQSERKTYLDEQNEDLTEALETLLTAIRKIDKETRARFRETYDQVNEGLQRLFPKIFGGGSAHLELTDDDLLETGVSIIARPPGKKNSTIHLLSGGEKALTAIALIFAIFELNPAPFCMLDEVDAPLDDANVGRFANMVKEMSGQVQFIYISHNKVSMEKADQLMGVTMHEPGVSRLVSVDVEEAAALAEL